MAVNEEQARSIFLAALERAADQWPVYLDEACSGNAELRARVDQLLQAHRAMGSIHGGVEAPAAVTASFAPSDPVAGSVIAGRYKLLELIGEGGMGTVWMAEQLEPVRRKVALKLIKPGMDSRQVIARFEAERQALALMDHPNIARVLDAGTTGSRQEDTETRRQGEKAVDVSPSPCLPVPLSSPGRPFFVMELVKGVPITKYCDEHRLTPRQRLELFVPVCNAIQHAHQKGIIHRDLKPSNVLVALYDDRPVPKVIDFGVAKATGKQLTEETLHTGFGAVVGTVEYMSPEQASLNQLDVDTRSDIYALGVLLYELLAGSPPFSRKDLEQAGMLEMLRVIREQEPSKPSTKLSTAEGLPTLAANRGTEPAKLTKLVRGELDWIVMKALEKDRNRRYETANGFAMDVQRYLADEAVLAGPPSAWYRFRKFARRNKLALTTTAMLATALLLVAVVSVVSSVLILKERNTAWAERERAQAKSKLAHRVVDDMYTKVATKWLIDQKHLGKLEREFLEKALSYYQEFVKENPTDPALQEEMARVFERVGSIQRRLGQHNDSEEAYRQGISLFEKLLVDSPDDPGYRADLALIQHNLGQLLWERGRPKEAEQAYRHAVDLRSRLATQFPDRPGYRRYLAHTMDALGVLLLDTDRLPEAENTFGRSIQLYEQLVKDVRDVPQYWSELAASHDHLGSLLSDTGRRPEAEKAYRRALDIRQKLAPESENVLEYHRFLASSHKHLGSLLARTGRHKDAELEYRKALEFQEKLAKDSMDVPEYWRDVADTHNNLGALYYDMKRPLEAEQAGQVAKELWARLVARSPGVPDYQSGLAATLNNLATLAGDRGEHAEACQLLEQAIHHQKLALQANSRHPRYRDFLRNHYANRAGSLAERGDYDAAAKTAAEVPLVSPARWSDHQRAADLLENILRLVADKDTKLTGARRLALKQAWAEQAAQLLGEAVRQCPDDLEAYTTLGRSHFAWGNVFLSIDRLTQAEQVYRQAIAFQEKLTVERVNDPVPRSALGASLNNLATVLRRRGDLRESRRLLDQAIDHQQFAFRANPRQPTYRSYLRNHYLASAETLVDMGEHVEAAKAAAQLHALFPDIWRDYWQAARMLARCMTSAQQDEKFPPEKRTELAQSYGDQAIELLRQAIGKGFTNVDNLKKDPSLEPIRSRDDFKKLLAELETKQKE